MAVCLHRSLALQREVHLWQTFPRLARHPSGRPGARPHHSLVLSTPLGRPLPFPSIQPRRCQNYKSQAVGGLNSVLGNSMAAASISDTFAILTGYLVVAGSCIRSVPQILLIWREKSAQGISLSANVAELAAYSVMISYNVNNRYPFSTYGEVVACWIQDIILVVLILKFNNVRDWRVWVATILSTAVFYWMLTGSCGMPALVGLLDDLPQLALHTKGALVSEARRMAVFNFHAYDHVLIDVIRNRSASSYRARADLSLDSLLTGLQAATIPLIALGGRVPQIVMNWKRGNAGNLSLLTALMNVTGCLARAFTSIVLTQDMLNLTSCIVQGFLNSVLLYQILVPAKLEVASKEDGESEDLQTARVR